MAKDYIKFISRGMGKSDFMFTAPLVCSFRVRIDDNNVICRRYDENPHISDERVQTALNTHFEEEHVEFVEWLKRKKYDDDPGVPRRVAFPQIHAPDIWTPETARARVGGTFGT
jgi:hypothetical protein